MLKFLKLHKFYNRNSPQVKYLMFNIKKYNSSKVKNKKSEEYKIKSFLILNLNPKVRPSLQEIKGLYKKLAMKYHPDKYMNHSKEIWREYNEKFAEITEAYNFLIDEEGKNFEGFIFEDEIKEDLNNEKGKGKIKINDEDYQEDMKSKEERNKTLNDELKRREEYMRQMKMNIIINKRNEERQRKLKEEEEKRKEEEEKLKKQKMEKDEEKNKNKNFVNIFLNFVELLFDYKKFLKELSIYTNKINKEFYKSINEDGDFMRKKERSNNENINIKRYYSNEYIDKYDLNYMKLKTKIQIVNKEKITSDFQNELNLIKRKDNKSNSITRQEKFIEEYLKKNYDI